MNYYVNLRLLIVIFFVFAAKNSSVAQSQASRIQLKIPIAGPGKESCRVYTNGQGKLYVTGTFTGATVQVGTATLQQIGNGNGFIAQFDTSGSLNWIVQLRGNHAAALNELIQSASVDPTGGLIVAGNCTTLLQLDNFTFLPFGAKDSYIARFASNGRIHWIQSLASSQSEFIDDVNCDNRGNIWIGGRFTGPSITVDSYTLSEEAAGGGNIFFARLDTSGQIRWARTPAYCRITDPSASIINSIKKIMPSVDGTKIYLQGDVASPLSFFPNNNGNPNLPRNLDQQISSIYGYGNFLATLDSNGLALSQQIVTSRAQAQFLFGSNRIYHVDRKLEGLNTLIISNTISVFDTMTYRPFPDLIYHPLVRSRSFVQYSTNIGSGNSSPFLRPIDDAQPGAQGSVWLAGTYKTGNIATANDQFTLIQWDSTLNTVDSFSLGGPDYAQAITTANAIAVDPSSNQVYIAGSYKSNIPLPLGTNMLAASQGIENDWFIAAYRTGANPVLQAFAGRDTTICLGQSVTLGGQPTAANGSGSYTYHWTPTEGLSNSTTANPIANPSSTTTYQVLVTDVLGQQQTSNVVVNVSPNPETPVIVPSGPVSFCMGGQVSLSTSGTGVTYLWNNGATTPTIIATQPGSYSVTTRNSAGCTARSADLRVMVNPLPTTPTISSSGPTSFCSGNQALLTASPSANYLWSTGSTNASITVNDSGSYWVQAITDSGCRQQSNPISITVFPTPPIPIITQFGNTLQSSNSTGNQWFYQGSAIAGATGVEHLLNLGGTYFVQTTNDNGCQVTSAPLFVVRMQQPSRNGIWLQIAPNPTKGSAMIYYQLSETSLVSIWLLDGQGRRIRAILPNQQQPMGSYSFPIQLATSHLPTGSYFVQLHVNQSVITKSVLVQSN